MKIKYVNIKEIEWCCKDMEYEQGMHGIFYLQRGEAWLDLYNENKDWVHQELNYCPFCGKEVVFI